MGLVPGVSLAQWIGTRLAATSLSYVSRLLPSSAPPDHDPESPATPFMDAGYGR